MRSENGIPRPFQPNILAQRVADLERQLKELGARRTFVAVERIVEGGTLDVKVAEQVTRTVEFVQAEEVKAAPPPPAPSAPTLDVGPGLLVVSWDGRFVGAPEDVKTYASVVELHLSPVREFVPGADTVVDTFSASAGAGSRTLAVNPVGGWFAVLVTRSADGKQSSPSAVVGAVVPAPIGGADVDALRDEFAAADAELSEALRGNAERQDALSSEVTSLREDTLPALQDGLEQAGTRLDAADTLLNVTFPMRITDVEAKADTAVGRADAAVTAAGSAARVLYSIGNPSGTAREGDTWRKVVSNTGDVIGEWRYTTVNGAGAWRPQKVTSDMVSNLDVGKLTAGTAVIESGVLEKIAAGTASIQKADIGNLTVTGASALNTVTAERIAANVGRYISLTTDQLVAGTASIGTGVADRFFADIFSTRRLTANQVFIGSGSNLIPDPGFLDSTLNTGRQARSTGTWTLVPGTATDPAAMQHVMASTNDAFQYWTTTPVAGKTGEMLRVAPGQVFSLSVDVTTSATASCRWNAYLLKADGSVSYTGLLTKAGSGRRALTQEYTIPAGVVAVAFAVACLTNGVTFTVHGNAVVTEKVTPSLIVDGFFRGLRVIGASVETNELAGRGVKMNDAGLFGYDVNGKETLRFDGQNSILTGATVRTAASGARVQISEAGLEGWDASNVKYLTAGASGLEMTGSISTKGKTTEATPRDLVAKLATTSRVSGSTVATPSLVFLLGDTDPALAPGIYSPDGDRLVIGAQDPVRGSGTITAGYHGVTLGAGNNNALTASGLDITIGNWASFLGPATNTDLRGNVKVNGKTIEPRPWTIMAMPSGRTALDGNKPAVRIDSTGEYLEFAGGVVVTTGAASGATIVTIPDPAMRPTVNKNFVVATSSGPLPLSINPQGNLHLNPANVPAGGWIDFSQLRFALNSPR